MKFRSELITSINEIGIEDIALPEPSIHNVFVYLFSVISVPLFFAVSLMEITRTRQNLKSSFEIFIPVYLTKSSITKELSKTRKLSQPFEKCVTFHTHNFKIIDKSKSKLASEIMSPMLPFLSLFPIFRSEKYISLQKYTLNDRNLIVEVETLKLPFLTSISDTYLNLISHFFFAHKKDLNTKPSHTFISSSLLNGSFNPFLLTSLFLLRFFDNFKKIIRELIRKEKYFWFVRIQDLSDSVGVPALEIVNPEKGYYADPFLVSNGEKMYLFVEEYSFVLTKGFISVFEIQNKKAVKLGVCIEESFHISFPNVFKLDSDFYMIPESSANNDIRLYKCTDFPLKWELSSILMNDISAVDTLIYQDKDLFHLFTTVDLFDLGDHSTSLLHFFSKKIDSSKWIASKKNPVKIDTLIGRNGGKITSKSDVFYRVSQGSEYGTYGKKTSLFQINTLRQHSYSETEVESPKLQIPNYAKGHHHISRLGDLVAFDYSRFMRS